MTSKILQSGISQYFMSGWLKQGDKTTREKFDIHIRILHRFGLLTEKIKIKHLKVHFVEPFGILHQQEKIEIICKISMVKNNGPGTATEHWTLFSASVC